jgi:homoserine dehydrogenase
MMKEVAVIVYGVGGVGRALLRQMLNGRSVIANRNQLQFNVVALADSRNWQSDLDGLKDEQIQAILNA